MNESILVECANWLYAHKTEANWWTPYVLTEHNPDKSNPSVSVDDAYEVFVELRRRRLVGHTMVPDGKKTFAAFTLLEGKEKEWQCLMRKAGFWQLRAVPSLKWFLSKVWLVIVFTLATLATFYLNHFAAKSVERQEAEKEYRIRVNDKQFDTLLRSSDKWKEDGQPSLPPDRVKSPAK